MAIASDSSVERSNKVVAQGRYVSSKDDVARSSRTQGESPGGGGGHLLGTRARS